MKSNKRSKSIFFIFFIFIILIGGYFIINRVPSGKTCINNYDSGEDLTNLIKAFDFVSDKNNKNFEYPLKTSDNGMENNQTELINLNPATEFDVLWGSKIRFRVLFNATHYKGSMNMTKYPDKLGPTEGNLSYNVYRGQLILSNSLYPEQDIGVGHYFGIIDTKSDNISIGNNYQIEINATKDYYKSPTPLILQFDVNPNVMIVNQSQNNNSLVQTHWDEDIDMSVKAYGQYEDFFAFEDIIYENNSYNFQFSIPDIEDNWNLTEIYFDISNYTGIGGASEQSLHITDPWGIIHNYNESNGLSYFGDGNPKSFWTGVSIPSEYLNKSRKNNIFNFIFNGTFSYSINITAHAKFLRDQIRIQYTQFNITDSILIPYVENGWVINNITFNVYNCKNSIDWSDINPEDVNLTIRAIQNFTHTNRFTYSIANTGIGQGFLIIDNLTLYPYDNYFSFSIDSENSNVMFNVNISVGYIPYFYGYYQINNILIKKSSDGILPLGNFQIDSNNPNWDDQNIAKVIISEVNNGTHYFLPTEVDMNITIKDQTFPINEEGEFLLSQFSDFKKNQIFNSSITTNQYVNFTLKIQDDYSKTIFKDLKNNVSSVQYSVSSLGGLVPYNSTYECYIQKINTTALDVRTYNVIFTAQKEYYSLGIKQLELDVLARPTIVNDSQDPLFNPFICVNEAKNFTLEYKDVRRDIRVNNCETLYYNWWKLESNGSRSKTEYGFNVNNITETPDSLYVLDFDTAHKLKGRYEISAHIGKDNYEEQMIFFFLTIVEGGPNISIIEPAQNDNFWIFAPSFIVKITHPMLDTMWYSLNNGKNITFTSNGTFNNKEWYSLDYGPVIITFYANDTAGNINSKIIIVNKEILIIPRPKSLFSLIKEDKKIVSGYSPIILFTFTIILFLTLLLYFWKKKIKNGKIYLSY